MDLLDGHEMKPKLYLVDLRCLSDGSPAIVPCICDDVLLNGRCCIQGRRLMSMLSQKCANLT